MLIFVFQSCFIGTIGPHERGKHAHRLCVAVTIQEVPTNRGNINSSHIRLDYTWQHPELEACKKLNRSTIELTVRCAVLPLFVGRKIEVISLCGWSRRWVQAGNVFSCVTLAIMWLQYLARSMAEKI